MSTLHLVDPELRAAIELFPPLDVAKGLAPLRESWASFVPDVAGLSSPEVTVTSATVPNDGSEPAVPLIIHRPSDRAGPLPVFLHIHGGGFVLGSAALSTPANIALAERLGCMVVSVEYRLAPEATGSQPVEDCYRALAWVVENATTLGIDPNRIAIGGESAGGGLAASLALMARDRGKYRPCLQLLLSPMLDERTGPGHPTCGEFVWTGGTNQAAWAIRIGDHRLCDDHNGHIVPARAADLSDLPPAYIATGALDLFFDEDLAYAARLVRAGVPVELDVYPGAYHGFELAAEAAVTRRALADRYAALTRAFVGV